MFGQINCSGSHSFSLLWYCVVLKMDRTWCSMQGMVKLRDMGERWRLSRSYVVRTGYNHISSSVKISEDSNGY